MTLRVNEKRERYKKCIVQQLYFHHTLSCLQLSNKIDKSLPFTTQVLGLLIQEGVVKEDGVGISTGGRKPSAFTLCPDKIYVVTIVIEQATISLALIDIANNQISQLIKVEHRPTDCPEISLHLVQHIHQLIGSSDLDKKKIKAIGIGASGLACFTQDINYTIDKESLVATLSEATHLPVFVHSISSLAAMAELYFGTAMNRKNVAVIYLGWEMGLGMILNGEIYNGTNGVAGEFSHLPLFNNNRLCSCGKSGCLQTEASLPMLVHKTREGLKNEKLSALDKVDMACPEKAFDMIVCAALKGDRLSVELISEAGYDIGRGAAVLVHLLNPDAIIISGHGASAGKLWQAPIQQALNEHSIPMLSRGTEIMISKLGNNAVLLGAAAMAMKQD